MSSQDVPGITREEEESQLAQIIGIAQQNLDRAKADIRKTNEELADLLEVYDTKDKEGLSLWNNATARLMENEHSLVRLEKARKKPYFGRIDFIDPNVKSMESYYIGRIGIAKNASEPVVLDWRAPIASVYYESNMGPCRYTVSSEGTFEIDLKRKRTYEIENDKLKDYFDSDVVANDELLTRYLARNKKAVLGEIIATIQKEQNLIIRRSPKTNIIVQGVAGSGKTTVAMHRISYILYNYKDDFRPEDFYIIGSNRILLNYITSVLPELDVYGIRQMTMEQLFTRLLYEDWDETKYEYHSLDKSDDKNCIKGSAEWFSDLENYCMEYEKASIPMDEIYMEKTGNLLAGENLISTYLKDHPQMSMESKILMLNEIIYAKYENEVLGKNVSFPAKEKKILDRKYASYFGNGKWEGNVYEFYTDFLKNQAANGKEVDIPEYSFDVYDLAALAYIYKRIKETDPVREASHVVIDEAQDFGMMAYDCLHYCLRGCTYTIMGDTSQNIHFQYGLNDWEQLRKLILTGTYDSFGLLRKSYRNTVEISEFANEILKHGDFSIYPVEPIIRHGNKVRVEAYQTVKSLFAEVVTTIENWQKEGYETIAVICRDEEETQKVQSELKKQIEIADCDLQKATFGDGVMVLPVSYTKGLEFDAVLLFDPSKRKYPNDNGHVKLLYVAATRALHELAVLHRGRLTGIIADPVPEGKHVKELTAETLTKAKEYEKQELTQKEVEQKRRTEGDLDRNERSYIGPKRIVVKPAAEEKAPVMKQSRPVNPSPYAYGAVPENQDLRIKGHSRGNCAIKWAKKTKKHIDLASAYGILRITPITKEIIRISFVKGVSGTIADTFWKAEAEEAVSWGAKESRTIVEVATDQVVIRIDKKSGALQFGNKEGKMLLAENAQEPRRINDGQTWTFFDWEKSERIKSKGILATDLMDLTLKARYISFGQKSLRMPLIVSGKGYGIASASSQTVLFCNIRTYGQYLYTKGDEQIDYYFIYGQSVGKTIELYQSLTTN
ncbi:MAG: DUF4968 domain-containing protein [Roseburia porci]|nr:DUF4968 domain-containing protein [Roseburia porci]